MFLVPYILTNTWIFLHPSWVRWLKKKHPSYDSWDPRKGMAQKAIADMV